MGKSTKNRVPLSRTATAVHKCSGLPDVLARTCGQFVGSDMPYNPGDTLVREVPFGNGWSPEGRHVWLVRRIPNEGLMRWYHGKRYDVYKVLRVTPCTVRVRKQTEVHVYEKWMRQANERTDEVAGIFTININGPETTLHARDGDAMNRQEFDKLDLSTATKVRIIPQIQHDAELNKLVVVDHSWST